jgi:hypothetical protein
MPTLLRASVKVESAARPYDRHLMLGHILFDFREQHLNY